jgi:hypothetical protein
LGAAGDRAGVHHRRAEPGLGVERLPVDTLTRWLGATLATHSLIERLRDTVAAGLSPPKRGCNNPLRDRNSNSSCPIPPKENHLRFRGGIGFGLGGYGSDIAFRPLVVNIIFKITSRSSDPKTQEYHGH